FFCFFFQAEDGIRDPLVTGVQTCALPISRGPRDRPPPSRRERRSGRDRRRAPSTRASDACLDPRRARRGSPRNGPPERTARAARSEERRVGKEGRAKRPTDEQREREGLRG